VTVFPSGMRTNTPATSPSKVKKNVGLKLLRGAPFSATELFLRPGTHKTRLMLGPRSLPPVAAFRAPDAAAGRCRWYAARCRASGHASWTCRIFIFMRPLLRGNRRRLTVFSDHDCSRVASVPSRDELDIFELNGKNFTNLRLMMFLKLGINWSGNEGRSLKVKVATRLGVQQFRTLSLHIF